MKKRNIILIVIVVLLLIGGVVLFINIFNKEDNKIINKQNELVKKDEYYKNMKKRMYDYYKIVYKNLNIPEEKKSSKIRINLGTLKTEGFPMDEFVSYDGKENCDIALSYAVRKVIDNKYKIEVYYKCGNDSNYKYPTTKKTDNFNSTTKKHSITKEEFDKNKTTTKAVVTDE